MTNSNKLNMTWPHYIYDDMTHVAQLVGFVESCSSSQCHDVDFLDRFLILILNGRMHEV